MGCNSSSQAKVCDVAHNPNADTKGKAEECEKDEKVEDRGNGDNSNMLTVPENRPSHTSSPVPSPSFDESFSNTRLLLLGSAESGKTTVLEQVRLLYKQNFTESEMYHRKSFIYNNVHRCIQSLAEAMRDFKVEYSDPTNAERARAILEDEDGHYGLFPDEVADRIKRVWNDEAVQKLYAKRSAFNLNDSASYFLNNLDKINNPGYMPNEQDLIMSYIPTVGVQNVVFTANNHSFQLFDIGGQKIDRRKWATQYDGIDAIFFCIAISEYDQVMSEDMQTNRLVDALSLLSQISEEPKFAATPIYLFLNEVDVFCEKLDSIPLKNFQPMFTGESEEEALEFIEKLAISALSARDANLYRVYQSIAIDRSMMAKILCSVFKDLKKRNR